MLRSRWFFYGCTEFVFRFDPAVLQRGDVLEIERRIDEWVPLVEPPSPPR